MTRVPIHIRTHDTGRDNDRLRDVAENPGAEDVSQGEVAVVGDVLRFIQQRRVVLQALRADQGHRGDGEHSRGGGPRRGDLPSTRHQQDKRQQQGQLRLDHRQAEHDSGRVRLFCFGELPPRCRDQHDHQVGLRQAEAIEDGVPGHGGQQPQPAPGPSAWRRQPPRANQSKQ